MWQGHIAETWSENKGSVSLSDKFIRKPVIQLFVAATMRHRQNAAGISFKNKAEFDSSVQEEDNNTSGLDTTRRIFLICLAVRAINSLLVQTYFNPDEHWQGPEVAHRLVFGYGHLTWEWRKGIRSYLHPLLFAFLYKVLSLFHLDFPWVMMKAPRLLQSIFAAVGDLYLYKYADAIFGSRVALWTLFSQLTNWFMFFCITRALSNSLETVLTIVSLYYWPCMRMSSTRSSSSRKLALVIAAISCAVRPTSAITWMYIGLLEVLRASDRLKFIFAEVLPIGALVIGVTCILDRAMYGSWILVPLNFLKFNFLSSGGDYYGTHKWHWYLSQGFTVMLFSFLPLSVAGIVCSRKWKVAGLIGWVLGVYSLLGHKEFRFVLPVLPVALMFSGYSLAAMRGSDPPLGKSKGSLRIPTKCPPKMFAAVFFLLASNIPMALYMSLVHQRGTEDVMGYLAEEAAHGEVRHILFLMPCHATPYYSAIHHNVSMRFLDCTPSEERGRLDESDRFVTDPPGFISELSRNWTLPSHIVLFDSEEKALKDFLASNSFEEVKRFFHAHFKVDRDLQGSVVVYAFRGW